MLLMAMELQTRAGRRQMLKRGRRVSFVGVVGEVFITMGVVVLLFLGWQLWFDNLVDSNAQNTEAHEQQVEWDKGDGTAPASVDRPDPGEPAVGEAPGNAERFAVLIIPRLGADWTKPVREGIGTKDVLNFGIGHYPGTAMPGAVGNAAFAGHRTGYGSPFFDIVNLQVGDPIFVETEAGWYKYIYRSMEYVMPDGVGVLDPVPQVSEAAPTDRIITLTSCNPAYSASERVIAYGVYDTWYPRAGGPPPEIATVVTASAGG
jgi:sortase A